MPIIDILAMRFGRNEMFTSFNGTRWSCQCKERIIVNKTARHSERRWHTMSRSAGMVVGTLSYGETHSPDVTAHEEELMTMFVPSLFNTAAIVQILMSAVKQ